MRLCTNLKEILSSRYHRRRGLATIVTGAIMLSAVAILGTTTVSWANSNLVTHQEILVKSYSEKTNKIAEYVTIENVWAGGTSPNKFLNITLTNVGNIGLTLTEIKIDGITSKVTPIINGDVVPGGTYSTIIYYDWNINEVLNVYVTTERDSIFRTQAVIE